MVTAAGRWPDVASFQLNPRVSTLVDRLLGQSDDENGPIPLGAKQPKEDEGSPEAGRVAGHVTERPVDRRSEPGSGVRGA